MKKVTLEKTQKEVYINGKKAGRYEMLGDVAMYTPDKSEISHFGGSLYNSKTEMVKSLGWEMKDFKF